VFEPRPGRQFRHRCSCPRNTELAHTIHMKIERVELPSATSNRELITRHARPGCIGLCSSDNLFSRTVHRASRRLDDAGTPGSWSHAFIFQEKRSDGRQWVIESDLEVHRRNIRLGVQENRADKFFDEQEYPNFAVLDLGLDSEQVGGLISAGLEMVAGRVRYSIRELFGALTALHIPKLRSQDNRFGNDRSIYCSALVLHLFRQIGLDLVPGVHPKRTTPDDIARTPVPHKAHIIKRLKTG
jgi:hypothetical protein